MVKLNKQNCPQILQDNRDKWTNDLLVYINGGRVAPKHIKERYKHRDIKKAVIEDSYSKCIYCESTMLTVSYGDIEHIKPKDAYPHLSFDWDNLGFVCTKCNVIKGNIYDDQAPFVNPFEENPHDFLEVFGLCIYSKLGNQRGKITELGLQLNRTELIEKRMERIEHIRSLAETYNQESNPTLKQLLLDEIKKEFAPDKPYSFCSKSYYEKFLGTTL